MVETILKINEAMKYCDNVGYVYPTDKESYYINSNIQIKLEVIECNDGYFYARVTNDEIRSIRQVESFYSPSLEALYHQIALKNNDNDFEPYEEWKKGGE